MAVLFLTAGKFNLSILTRAYRAGRHAGTGPAFGQQVTLLHRNIIR